MRLSSPQKSDGGSKAGFEGGSLNVSMAQWIAHRTSNPGVVGSSPTVDVTFCHVKCVF